MTENAKLLRDISDLYHNQGMTQADIAQRFGLSRAKVCRMLAAAKEQGIVRVFVADSDDTMQGAEADLQAAFGLQNVKVLSVPPADPALALQIAAGDAAKFLSGILEDGDKIGVGWGSTLYEISKCLPPLALNHATLMQLSGNLDNADKSNHALQIVHNFATKLSAKTVYTLPCPAIVGNQIIYDILLHDEKISRLVTLVNQCDKMIVNIGIPAKTNCLCYSGYVSDEQLERLLAAGVVGSICCHFYDCQGCIVEEDLDKRTTGVSLQSILNCKHVITCAIGIEKAQALYAALKAGFINSLVVDYVTACAVLARHWRE